MGAFPFENKKFSPSLDAAADNFVQDCQAKNLAGATIVSYREHIRYFKTYLIQNKVHVDLNDIDADHVKKFIVWLSKKPNSRHPERPLSSTTVKKTVITLKTFLRYCHDEGYIDKDFYLKIKTPKSTKKVIDSLSMAQVKKLLEQMNGKKFSGYRDYVMTLILCDSGLRLSELLNIKTSDIDMERGVFTVHGKGNKERFVPFGVSVKKALKKYLLWRGNIPDEKYVFVNLCGRKLDARRFQRRLHISGVNAGVGRVYPHLLRHTFAKHYVMHGGDPFSLQMIMGHTTLDMVKHYVTLAQQEISFQHRKYSMIDSISTDIVNDKTRMF